MLSSLPQHYPQSSLTSSFLNPPKPRVPVHCLIALANEGTGLVHKKSCNRHRSFYLHHNPNPNLLRFLSGNRNQSGTTFLTRLDLNLNPSKDTTINLQLKVWGK